MIFQENLNVFEHELVSLEREPYRDGKTQLTAVSNNNLRGNAMRVAYARVSSSDQSLNLQIDALKNAGCDKIFTDHGVSGVAAQRPGLNKALEALNEGDTLMVWRLDRLARSMRELTDIVWALHHRGIKFQSLCEQFDVSSAFGELILHVLGAIAHFERALIIERTRAGIEAAKERGVKFGRRPVLNGEELCEALSLVRNGMTVSDVANHLKIGTSTLYRYLADVRDMRERAA